MNSLTFGEMSIFNAMFTGLKWIAGHFFAPRNHEKSSGETLRAYIAYMSSPGGGSFDVVGP